jgi:hypothetical protein
MLTLPAELVAVLVPFTPLFTQPSFSHLQVLVMGALLTPGQRTVASCLRAAGHAADPHFTNFHRFLNRARWSSLTGARTLYLLLVKTFVPSGPILLGLDDTIERRRGEKIKARGIYRDPVRSSHGHFVKCGGLRWLGLMLLAQVPFAAQVWALPFLTALCPSQRYSEHHRPMRGHKKLTDWARQMVLQVHRWMPWRQLIVVADSSFAVVELLAAWIRQPNAITAITRLRMDAAIYEPPPPPQPGRRGRPPKTGKRLPTPTSLLHAQTTQWHQLKLPQWYSQGKHQGNDTDNEKERVLEVATGTAVWTGSGKPVVPIRWVLIRDPRGEFQPQALLCTDLALNPEQIVTYFVRRWRLEVTFREVREHLGVETQRQWSDAAIARTTPLLLALYSVVTLVAHRLVQAQSPVTRHRRVRTSAWYHKSEPTFSDALAWVRHTIWFSNLPQPEIQHENNFCSSRAECDVQKMRQAIMDTMTDLLCYAR